MPEERGMYGQQEEVQLLQMYKRMVCGCKSRGQSQAAIKLTI